MQLEPQITRSIEVKGYLHTMHADLKEQRMKGGPYAYTSAYKTAQIPSRFFDSKQDNIDRAKMEEFYLKQMGKKYSTTSEEVNKEKEEESSFKAITYTTRKPK